MREVHEQAAEEYDAQVALPQVEHGAFRAREREQRAGERDAHHRHGEGQHEVHDDEVAITWSMLF